MITITEILTQQITDFFQRHPDQQARRMTWKLLDRHERIRAACEPSPR